MIVVKGFAIVIVSILLGLISMIYERLDLPLCYYSVGPKSAELYFYELRKSDSWDVVENQCQDDVLSRKWPCIPQHANAIRHS